MHDIMEMQCRGCGFSVRGIPQRGIRARRCSLCDLPMAPRPNYSVSRRLPLGMGLLMGAFAASLDSSPLTAAEPAPVAGYARHVY